MPTSKQNDESFSTIIRELSEKLTLISSNSKLMQQKCINVEMKNLSNSVHELAPIFSKTEKDNYRKKNLSELTDISYDIDHAFQFFSSNGDIQKVASELKAIHTKLEKTSKKLQTSINPNQDKAVMEMNLNNAPIPTLTVSGKTEDKERIISLLLGPQPCIVPIIHKHESNSTKFAQGTFKDKRLANHFTRTIWVDAARLIDLEKLDKLVQKRPSTLFWVIKTLNKDLEEVGVLLVLDDIKKKLRLGTMYVQVDSMKSKSKVCVSTCEKGGWFSDDEIVRSEKMTVGEAWEVLMIQKNKMDGSGYERIGKEMLGKMERWGSMVEALKIVLSGNVEVTYWKMMAEGEFWRMPFDEEEVLSVLLGLCYDMGPLESELYHVRCGGKHKICALFI